MNALKGLLSLCIKAGKLRYGYQTVVNSVKSGEAKLVIASESLSDKTRKEIAFFAEREKTELISTPLTLEDFDYLMGKRTGVISILDAGFACKVKELLATVEKGR